MAEPFLIRKEPEGLAGVVHISLNRPDARNAMDAVFWRGFPELLRDLADDPSVRAVVLSGEGPHFSAGIDLGFLQSLMPTGSDDAARRQEKMRRIIRDLQASFTVVEDCRLPVVAAVHGACLGAALDLLSAVDIRVAAADAVFRIEEINIGMVADVGTLQRLPKLMAPAVVRDLALTGRSITADEALRHGFLSAVLETRDAAIRKAFEIAAGIAQKSPLAIAGTKAVLNYARDHAVADGLEQVATWNAGHLSLDDILRGLKAAKTRTRPAFNDLLK